MQQKQNEPEKEPWFLSRRFSSIRATTVQAWTLMAWSLLDQSDNIEPPLKESNGLRLGLPWMRIWDDAMSFGCPHEPFTLTVFQSFTSENKSFLRKAMWQRALDLRRLWDPPEDRDMPERFEPTLTVADAKIPRKKLEAVLDSGRHLSLPITKLTYDESITSDVGSMGFEFFTLNQPQARVRLEWSAYPPKEWEPA